MSFFSSAAKTAVRVWGTPWSYPLKWATGRDLYANKEDGANEYVATRLAIRPESFTGDYDALQMLISQETDACTAFVKQKGVLVGAAARDICTNKINTAYAGVLIDRQGLAYAQDQQVMSEFLSTNYVIIGIIVITILIVFFLIY